MASARPLRWVWLSLVIVLADRATKAAIEIFTFDGYRRAVIHNFIYLVHTKNPGIAFGIFSDSPPKWLTGLLIAGAFVVICALAWLLVSGHAGGKLSQAGIALILGGATGNLTDRLLHGGVTDFFEVLFGNYHYPAFNVADSAIAVGAAFVILELFFGARTAHEATSEPGHKNA
jgi:signal peptidase II